MSMSMSTSTNGNSDGTFMRFRIDSRRGSEFITSLVILNGGDDVGRLVREWDRLHALHQRWMARENIRRLPLGIGMCRAVPESGEGTTWLMHVEDLYELLPWNREPFRSMREEWYAEEEGVVATNLSQTLVGETRPLVVEGVRVGDVTRLEDGTGFTEEDWE